MCHCMRVRGRSLLSNLLASNVQISLGPVTAWPTTTWHNLLIHDVGPADLNANSLLKSCGLGAGKPIAERDAISPVASRQSGMKNDIPVFISEQHRSRGNIKCCLQLSSIGVPRCVFSYLQPVRLWRCSCRRRS